MKDLIRITSIALLILGCALLAPQALAGPFQLSQLYTASVPVAQQGSSDLDQGLRQALAKVLVRVTGQADIKDLSGADQILDRASSLVAQYGYHSSDKGNELRATFNHSSLNRAVREQNMPLWGRERPHTLVWLVVYNNGRRHLINRDTVEEGATGLLDGARERGLPLIFPSPGPDQGSTLSAADITGGFRERIAKASESYKTQHVVFGHAQPGAGGWQGSMTVMDSGKVVTRLQAKADSANDVLRVLVHKLADNYAGRYAIATGGQTSAMTLVDVGNIKSLTDYARVSQYLDSLTAVNSSRLVLLKGQTARFAVASDSSRETLAHAIALRDQFKRESGASGSRAQSVGQANNSAAGDGDAAETGRADAAFSLAGGGDNGKAPLLYRYQP